jgi:hypothetical protein
MRGISAPYLFTAGAVFLTLTACASLPSTSLFPTLSASSQAEKAQIIRSRTTGLRTLTAVLMVAFSGRERQGTFEMVVNYNASGKMRFTAFKDLMLSSRPIFDLIFARERYILAIHDTAGARMRQGNVAQFVQDNPEFRAFLVVGEAFFLPGFDGFGKPPVFKNTAASQFTTRLKSGFKAQWFAKPDTLEITKARLDGDGEQEPVSFLLEYSDYRRIEAYYIPGRVTLIDPHRGFITRTLIQQVEINMPLAEGIFDISSILQEQSDTYNASGKTTLN